VIGGWGTYKSKDYDNITHSLSGATSKQILLQKKLFLGYNFLAKTNILQYTVNCKSFYENRKLFYVGLNCFMIVLLGMPQGSLQKCHKIM